MSGLDELGVLRVGPHVGSREVATRQAGQVNPAGVARVAERAERRCGGSENAGPVDLRCTGAPAACRRGQHVGWHVVPSAIAAASVHGRRWTPADGREEGSERGRGLPRASTAVGAGCNRSSAQELLLLIHVLHLPQLGKPPQRAALCDPASDEFEHLEEDEQHGDETKEDVHGRSVGSKGREMPVDQSV